MTMCTRTGCTRPAQHLILIALYATPEAPPATMSVNLPVCSRCGVTLTVADVLGDEAGPGWKTIVTTFRRLHRAAPQYALSHLSLIPLPATH